MSEDETRDLLKTLFLEVGVMSTWKWDDALRNVSTEPRYKYVRMTMQEKKSVFNEFMVEQKRREQEQTTIKRQRQRELFIELLDENKQALKLNGLSKFYKISNQLAQKNLKKFLAVDERDRKEIFQDFVENLFQDELESKSNAYKADVQKIKHLLQSLLASDANPEGPICQETSWKEVNQLLKDEPVWAEVQDLERLTAFEEVIKTLDRTNYHLQKATRLRQERKRREAFREMV